jgi:hypothetical protein
MKVNQVITRAVVRIFFILLLVALVPFITGGQSAFQHVYLTFHHWWELIFPVLIISSFIFLLIACISKRYKVHELNWLLVVNIVVLVAYGIAIVIRIAHMN